jgi:hypothetical protein
MRISRVKMLPSYGGVKREALRMKDQERPAKAFETSLTGNSGWR